MKKIILSLGLIFGALGSTAQAQSSSPSERSSSWQTITYTLNAGWNSMYLHGDAATDFLTNLSSQHPEIVAIWQWNDQNTQLQVGNLAVLPRTPEWFVWESGGATPKREFGTLKGQTGYVVQIAAGTSNAQLSIPQKIQPPQSRWVRSGANFLGFPSRFSSGGTYPTFSNYFTTFPVALQGAIFKYVGGDLGPANPVQVVVSSSQPPRVDRTQAYWFESPVVSDFFAPVEVTSVDPAGLVFGKTGGRSSVRIYNRTSDTITMTVAPTDSEPAPAGQLPALYVTAPSLIPTRVPLLVAAPDGTTSALASSYAVGPKSVLELVLTVDRNAMSAAPAGATLASFLRFTDSSNFSDISIPVSAVRASMAGLWVGDITVRTVNSLLAVPSGTTVAGNAPFVLRALLHVSDGNKVRLLQKVFLGRLQASGGPGLCVREDLLSAETKSSASRIVAAHLPPIPSDQIVAPPFALGGFAIGQTVQLSFSVPFNAPTNPFVHAFHPDHDNKDGAFGPIGTGVESYDITRTCSFTFIDQEAVGWGASAMGGKYSETIKGLHQKDVVVTGTFTLRRLSESGVLAPFTD